MNRNRRLIFPPLLAAVGFAAALVALPSCTRPPTTNHGTSAREAVNPWQGVVAQLRKENDPTGCRRILNQLNNDLAQKPDAPHPASLTPEAEKPLRDLLKLRDDEVKEIRPASFSGLDPVYLAECLYLRDAARGLDLTGLPKPRQAELAFAWVCRQVVLQPWLSVGPGGQPVTMPPVPPSAVLRRGSGSGLERAYVFLALLQQLELDGAFIGPPESVERDWTYRPEGSVGLPRGPFWAVGARVGADVLLFDPWRGEPVPGAGGQGVGTLAQVKSNPDQLKPWREDKANPWKVAADEVKASVPVLAVPLSAVAPRLKELENELRADLPVRLTADPVALRARFAAEAKLPDLKFWNPQTEEFSYKRVLASFTPVAEGGSARDDQIALRYRASMIPPTLFAVPAELAPQSETDVGVPEAVDRIRNAAVNSFGSSFLVPPTPREEVQRGQFHDAAPRLVKLRHDFSTAQDRVRQDHDRGVKEWAEKAREVYTRLARARDEERTSPGAAAEAQRAVDQFWREGLQTFGALVDRTVADAGLAESTYLLALCKHEQAEQLQVRAGRQAADPKQKAAAERTRSQVASAWKEARAWWEKYEPFAPTQDRAFPGRAAHAKRLAEQAANGGKAR